VVTDIPSDICRSDQRKKMRANRLAFFRQRLAFAARQWRHNLDRHGLRLVMRTMR
jgi:hypothetical protein